MYIKNKMKSSLWFFLIGVMTISCNNRNNEDNQKEIKEIKQINPENATVKKSIFSIPFDDIQIENTAYQISGKRDTVLSYKTGSKIIIPKNAFLDKNGHPVKGKVTLTYREFTNAFDIYLGGIPMVYDTAGEEQVFETAGMLEINAYAQGQPVFPNPKKKIQVQMNSFQKGNKFNVYQLDTVTGKWDYLGKDVVKTKDFKEELDALPEIPEPPKRAGRFAFTLGDDTGKYPELNKYADVLFESIDSTYCEGSNATEIQVKDLGDGRYDVIFVRDAYGVRREKSCTCYLVFKEGTAYDNALSAYQQKYKALIDKQEKLRKEIEAEWKAYRAVLEQYNIVMFNERKRLQQESEAVIRTLEISRFGFINCDIPSRYPQGAELTAKYKDTEGNDLILSEVVLVEKGRNALFRYDTNIKYNPEKENILWGITRDRRLAYFKPKDFDKIKQSRGTYTFVMHVYSGDLTYENIREVLF